jgi:hypothetical protein
MFDRVANQVNHEYPYGKQIDSAQRFKCRIEDVLIDAFTDSRGVREEESHSDKSKESQAVLWNYLVIMRYMYRKSGVSLF